MFGWIASAGERVDRLWSEVIVNQVIKVWKCCHSMAMGLIGI